MCLLLLPQATKEHQRAKYLQCMRVLLATWWRRACCGQAVVTLWLEQWADSDWSTGHPVVRPVVTQWLEQFSLCGQGSGHPVSRAVVTQCPGQGSLHGHASAIPHVSPQPRVLWGIPGPAWVGFWGENGGFWFLIFAFLVLPGKEAGRHHCWRFGLWKYGNYFSVK